MLKCDEYCSGMHTSCTMMRTRQRLQLKSTPNILLCWSLPSMLNCTVNQQKSPEVPYISHGWRGSGNSCIDMNYVAMFLCDCIGGQDYWSLTDHSRGSVGAFDPVCLCARQKTFELSDFWPIYVGNCHLKTPFYSLSTTTSTACCFINCSKLCFNPLFIIKH